MEVQKRIDETVTPVGPPFTLMTLRSLAPTRIDLAGGTLDIWPLYLLIEPAVTVNVAIDLYAEVEVARGDGKWRWRDVDSGQELAAETPRELEKSAGGKMVGALLGVFETAEPLSVATKSLAPPRAGLGGSSALGIALAGALNGYCGFPYQKSQLVEIVKNVEARALGTLTGTQDHFPSVHGGALSLHWGWEGPRCVPLPLDGAAFTERFLLVYTRQTHRSGANNWEVVKRFLDGDQETRRALSAIGEIAAQMSEALAGSRLDAVPELLAREWDARQRLAPAVNSPEIERILQSALDAGAQAGKACGAGGGGCVLVAVEPSDRMRVEEAVRNAGGEPLTYGVASRGLRLMPDGEGPAEERR